MGLGQVSGRYLAVSLLWPGCEAITGHEDQVRPCERHPAGEAKAKLLRTKKFPAPSELMPLLAM